MAKQLAKHGAEALRPQLVHGSWQKPVISGRLAANLKKQFRLEGKEWPLSEEPKEGTRFGFGQKKKAKGHKHDKVAIERKKEIQAKLDGMPKAIADYRESVKLKDNSLLDKLLLTVKERREKQFRVAK